MYRPTTRRYPFVAGRFLATFIGVPRKVAAVTGETSAWYRRSIDSVPGLERAGAAALLADAQDRLVTLVTCQTIAVVAGLQPVYDALDKLVAKAGVGDVATLSGSGGAEMLGVVADLWEVSRGRLDLEAVVREHGFHGPREGELSSRVWREDPSPLERLVAEYTRRDDSQDPVLRERARQDEAAVMGRALLAALPAGRRLVVEVLERATAVIEEAARAGQ